MSRLESRSIACFVHAGSSSEYGDNAAAPSERDPAEPNSDYAVSKVAAAGLIYYLRQAQAAPLREPAALFGSARSRTRPG